MDNETVCEASGIEPFPPKEGIVKWIPVVFMFVTMISTLFFNVVLIVRMRNSKAKPFTKHFVTSLACSDFLVGITVMPYRFYGNYYDNRNLLGEYTCEITNSCDVIFTSTSILHLAALTFERYIAICQTFSYETWITQKSKIVLASICYGFPSILSFGMLMTRVHLNGIREMYECVLIDLQQCIMVANTSFTVLGSLICFYIPAIALVCFNFQVFKTVWQQQKTMSRFESPALSAHLERHKHARESRVAKTIGTLTAIFLFCWLPFFIMNVVDPFIEYQTDIRAVWVLTWLGYINSAVNPVLYLVLDRRHTALNRDSSHRGSSSRSCSERYHVSSGHPDTNTS